MWELIRDDSLKSVAETGTGFRGDGVLLGQMEEFWGRSLAFSPSAPVKILGDRLVGI